MLPVEFVVLGTPLSRYGGDAKRLWKRLVGSAAEMALPPGHSPTLDAVVLRIAYFYVYEPVADLDNIVKPIQDVLTRLVYESDIQVVDLVASMRPKDATMDRGFMSATLIDAFESNSSFVWVRVDRASSIEVFRDLG